MSQTSEEKQNKKLFDQTIEEMVDDQVEEMVVKMIHEDELLIDGQRFKILENKNQALDLDQLNQRYSQLFEKFDFIVGDLGFDQLRLRGFYYSDTAGVPLDMRISTLEDYLNEYCNFGCDYFVLERLDEKTVFPDYKKKSKAHKSSHKTKHRPHQNKKLKKKKQTEKRVKSKQSFQKTKSDKGKARVRQELSQPKEKTQTVEHQSANKSFQIKKKK